VDALRSPAVQPSDDLDLSAADVETVKVALAEFTALRDEIRRRSDAQQFVVNVNVTAVTAIAAVVLANISRSAGEDDSPDELLFLVPFLTTALAVVWTDHHHAIGRIGAYIRLQLADLLRDATGEEEVMRWEEASAKRGNPYRLFVAHAGIFLLPAATALGFLRPSADDATVLEGGLWLAGAFAIAFQSSLWWGVLNLRAELGKTLRRWGLWRAQEARPDDRSGPSV
jgi:hypothetical protein